MINYIFLALILNLSDPVEIQYQKMDVTVENDKVIGYTRNNTKDALHCEGVLVGVLANKTQVTRKLNTIIDAGSFWKMTVSKSSKSNFVDGYGKFTCKIAQV